MLDRLGWRNNFDAIICGDSSRKGKPHPDPYLAALGILGLAADRAVAVEDSVIGVRSAHAAGVRVIAVVPPDRAPKARKAGAVAAIGSLDRLLSMLE